MLYEKYRPLEWVPYYPTHNEQQKRLMNELSRSTVSNVLNGILSVFPAVTKVCWNEEKIEDIIVDPLACYVPYTYYPEIWGIYLKNKSIEDDFLEFIRNYIGYMTQGIQAQTFVSMIIYIFMVYMSMILHHETQHHILEDFSYIAEFGYRNLLRKIPRNAIEGFCEYYAFTMTEHYLHPQIVIFDVPLKPMEKTMLLRRVLSALYYHWKRNSDKVYRPRIAIDIYENVIKHPVYTLIEAMHRVDISSNSLLQKSWNAIIEELSKNQATMNVIKYISTYSTPIYVSFHQ